MCLYLTNYLNYTVKQIMEYRNKKLNRSLSPLTQHYDTSNLTISPDCYSKCIFLFIKTLNKMETLI